MQERIVEEHYGELLVGEALIEDVTSPLDPRQRYLVAAPTMRVPMDIRDTANAFLAFRGSLIAVDILGEA